MASKILLTQSSQMEQEIFPEMVPEMVPALVPEMVLWYLFLSITSDKTAPTKMNYYNNSSKIALNY